MAKYTAAYKCPLCGCLIISEETYEIPYDKLPDLLGKMMFRQQFANNPYLKVPPMHIPCKCEDGNVGLAYFAGFRKA